MNARDEKLEIVGAISEAERGANNIIEEVDKIQQNAGKIERRPRTVEKDLLSPVDFIDRVAEQICQHLTTAYAGYNFSDMEGFFPREAAETILLLVKRIRTSQIEELDDERSAYLWNEAIIVFAERISKAARAMLREFVDYPQRPPAPEPSWSPQVSAAA